MKTFQGQLSCWRHRGRLLKSMGRNLRLLWSDEVHDRYYAIEGVSEQLRNWWWRHRLEQLIVQQFTWYVSKGLKFWKIISEGKGWKMASSMSTFEIFWWVVSDMSISSIIVGRRMCRVSAKRWKLIFYHRTHEKRTFSTQKCRFRPENTKFVPKISMSTRKHRVKNTDFESKMSILNHIYRFWLKNTDFNPKCRFIYLFSCHHHWFNVFARGYFWSVTF